MMSLLRTCMQMRLMVFVLSLTAGLCLLAICDARTAYAMQPRQKPAGSLVLEVDDRSRVILGDLKAPALVFLDLRTEERRSREVSILPRLALRLDDRGGFAVFGSSKEGLPTSRFLVVRDGEVSEHELEEPVRATQGVVWRKGGDQQFIIADQGTNTLVFINVKIILKVEVMTSVKVPIGRYVTEGEPYSFALAGDDYLAISFRKAPHVDIVDLGGLQRLERIRQRGFTEGQSIAALADASGRNLLMVVRNVGTGKFVDLFALPPRAKKGAGSGVEFLGSTPAEPKGLDLLRDSRYAERSAAFEASNLNGTVWLGYGNWLVILKASGKGGAAASSLEPASSKKLPLDAIGKILFYDGERKVLISSSGDEKAGLFLVSPIEQLLGR